MRHSVSNSWLTRGVVTAATAGLLVAGAAPALADDDAPQGPKNVILLIGDGMGYMHIDSTSLYENGTANWQVRTDSAGNIVPVPGTPSQVFETWDHVDMTTYADGGSYDPERAWTEFGYVNDNPTDSAAAGTAMATGHKTYNSGLGVDADGNPVENLSERALRLGKAAGSISSVQFSHATPAAFYAHEESRNSYHAIADDGLRSDMTVIMGAGHPYYSDSNELLDTPDFGYISEESFNKLRDGQSDYAFVEDKADFEALAAGGETPDRVSGIAQVASTLQQGRAIAVDSGADYENPDVVAQESEPYQTPFNEGVPSLETMTKASLNVLDNDEDGFFLHVEGGAIDWTGHANETARNIEETQDFNASVEAVVDWVETNSNWEETLVIVTADHETGYLGGAGQDPDWTAMEGSAGATPVVDWYSGNHTNQLIPVFAKGANSAELLGRVRGTDPVRGDFIDNTDVANFLMRDLWAVPAEDDGDIPVNADIPSLGDDDAPAGALALTVAPGTTELGNARNAGDRLRLTGVLPTVSVSDSRAEGAWSVTGQASDLQDDDAVVRAERLGWEPFVVAGPAVPGAEVDSALAGGPGLAVPATLGAGAERGTAELSADVNLEVPVDTKAGSYSGAITVSLFAQD